MTTAGPLRLAALRFSALFFVLILATGVSLPKNPGNRAGLRFNE
jgi:hypothetical protein